MPAAEIPLSMLLVFVSAKLLSEAFERFGQPGIVGEILAGILIGPHVLGWMSPNPVLTVLSELGVMFLLFRVGLELKSSELMKVGGTALVVALGGVIVPFFAGWGLSALWGEPHLEGIFTGAAMVATSVGITAQVLAGRGLLQARASRIILAAAVIDDVLGLLVLALVSSLAKGKVNLLDLALTAGIAGGFTVFVAKWGTRTMHKVVPRVQARLSLAESEFAIAMSVLFGLSLLAVYAGVAAIVGAFLAGLALSESVDRRVSTLTDGVSELLVPFFLVGIGLHFDLRAFAGGSTIALALLIFVAAVVSKFVGCGLGAIRLGSRRRHPRGGGNGSARRSGNGRGTDRSQHGHHGPERLRYRRLHVARHYRGCPAVAPHGVPRARARPPGRNRRIETRLGYSGSEENSMGCGAGSMNPIRPEENQSGRKVFCVKFQREMPGLDEVPFEGHPLGQKIYENVSKEAWKMWLEHMKMLMNEYRLNLGTPEAQEFLIQQMENYFFGEGAALPPDFVPPRTKA